MAGYRRFVAYVYEYPDGKKGNGKGFIKVEARDGKCRMNYRVQGIYGKEEAPCKIYGFVRKSDGCEGIYLGECDLAGDLVQFQTEVPDQGLGGTAYGLNDLSGLVMLTGDGIMYGTGWDDRPVRLNEIRLPGMQEERQQKADRVPERGNNAQKEALETGAVQDELAEGVAAAKALMDAENPVALTGEVELLPSGESSEERVNPAKDNLEEMDYPLDTTVETEANPMDADRAERGNTMGGNCAEAGNAMEGNRAETGNAMVGNRAETGNAMEGNRAGGDTTMGGNRTERENAMEADWEAGNNVVDGNRAGRNNSMDATPQQGRYPSNASEGDPYIPPRINERGTYFPQHYQEDEPEPGQEEQPEQRMEPVAPSRTENTVQPVMEPSRSDMDQNRNTAMPDTDRNRDATVPDMERLPYTEEELYRETINHEIFGRDQYPDSEMRIEASDSTDAAEQSTWNPEGDREEDEVNLLEELDQDEDAIRSMRQMEKEVTEKKAQKPEKGELHEQSAQAARQPAVFAPFSDGEIVDCRQITPAELRILARRDRGLMNNNFLRHGYYRYHYLLLGKRRGDGRYILGVPGVYDRQECLMAGMFGFPNFKAAKTQGKAAMPRFGYWYRLIDTPDINRRNRS